MIRRRKPLRRNTKPIARRTLPGAKRRAAKAANTIDPDTWQAIVDYYEGRCAYDPRTGCGGAYEVQDHVRPIAKGGENLPENVVPACQRCNNQKFQSIWEVPDPHPFMKQGVA